jgi:chromosome partitioning protein
MEICVALRKKQASAVVLGDNKEFSSPSPATAAPKFAKIILLSSAKGGSAKTTSTRNLAVLAARDGYRVATVDLDLQHTLTRWWNRRAEELPAIAHFDKVTMSEADHALSEIAALDDFDLVFVDTPPGVEHDTDQLRGVIKQADIVLIPTSQGGEDLESVAEWMKLVRRERTPAYFLLCKTDRDVSSLGEARHFLSSVGKLCPHDVRQMQAVMRTYFEGKGVGDLTGKMGRKAAEDYEAVWNFIRFEMALEDAIGR